MIFNASYLNDHNEIWDVGHTVGKLYYALSNDVIENLCLLTSLTALSTGTGF